MSDTDNPPRIYRTRHPMLIGFLAGSVLGVGVSLGVAMFVNRVASPFVHRQSAASGAAAAHASTASTAEKPSEKPAEKAPNPQEQMSAVAGPAPMTAPGNKPAKPVAASASVDTVSAAGPGGRNFLQVGSFAAAADADNRKAKLALLGFEAMVRAVAVPNKGTVHRVIVGPFATAAELDEAKAELAANNYASSLISRQAMAGAQ
jgi:cell division protein FtsN